MSSKQSRFLQKQKLAVGFFAAIVLLVLAYLAVILVKEAPMVEGFTEGVHYFALENPRRIRGETVEVMEFFSYGCIHCFNLDDDLNDWVEENGDKIKFVRTPVIANEQWRLYGRAYYAMQANDLLDANHKRVFREIHDSKRNIPTPEKFADVLGLENPEPFLEVFNSLSITQKVERADQLARRFKIATVPNIVVNGKYLVRASNSVGLSRMMDVIDHLIELEEAAASASSK
ncbi:MAG: thiol:disulfide interchange protein DsbA [Candidatus Azotimanducaceae bacterium]|jgi:thiol:disulfide interchange protein DsbA